MRSHRIPKFLTKPWEKDGKFKVFSLKEKKISTKNAGYFFSEKDIFTPEQEKFWNENVEAPLSYFFNNRAKIEVNKNGISIVDEKYIRAMCLLLFTIIERSKQYEGKKMNDLFSSDVIIESLKGGGGGRYGLYMLDASYLSQRLMFPEYGFCPIPYLTKKGIPTIALGVPVLGDKMLITYYKRTQNPEDIKEFSKRKVWFLFAASISNVGDKVIIHPDLLKYAGEQELSQALIRARSDFCQYIDEKWKKEINH